MALRASAEGLFAAEAAVELLVSHQRWLFRVDFVDGFVESGEGWSDGRTMAWVDWSAAVAALDGGRLVCGDSEAGMLRVAASIAEGVAVDLRGVLGGLDAVNVALVAAAVLHANGGRDAAAFLGAMRR